MLTFKSLLTLQTIYLLLLYNLAKITNTFFVQHKYFMEVIQEFHIFARVYFTFSNRQRKATVSIEYQFFVFIFLYHLQIYSITNCKLCVLQETIFLARLHVVISTHKMYDSMCNLVLVPIQCFYLWLYKTLVIMQLIW